MLLLKIIMQQSKKFSENASFQRVLADALSIQDRFQAEPVYSRMGKGFLKSAGVGELVELKKNGRKNKFPMGQTEAWLGEYPWDFVDGGALEAKRRWRNPMEQKGNVSTGQSC